MKSFQNKTPITKRSGSAPRTICLPHSTSTRAFEYQRPLTLNVELKGNLSIKPLISEPKEITPFRKVTRHEIPNSNRTLIPELGPQNISTITRSRSVKNFNSNRSIAPGNLNNLFLREDSVNKYIKVTNPKVYKSFTFGEEVKEQDKLRRNIKEVVYKMYDTTTQIVHLPGGVKRSNTLINDDGSNNPTKNNQSYHTKVLKDYNSNISCLPGSIINEDKQRPLIKNRKFLTSDIFNTNSSNNSNNTFNISNRKTENLNKYWGQSNNEKKLIENPKAHRPYHIKNAFVSQIQII